MAKKLPTYDAKDYKKAVYLADTHLRHFIKSYHNADNVSTFILGHAFELYSKALYLKIKGEPNFSHNIYNILNSLTRECPDLSAIIKHIDENKDSNNAFDLVFNYLADIKYIGYIHLEMPNLDNQNIQITVEDLHIFAQYLNIIFKYLDYSLGDSIILNQLLQDADYDFNNHINGINVQPNFFTMTVGYISSISAIKFLKLVFDPGHTFVSYEIELADGEGNPVIKTHIYY